MATITYYAVILNDIKRSTEVIRLCIPRINDVSGIMPSNIQEEKPPGTPGAGREICKEKKIIRHILVDTFGKYNKQRFFRKLRLQLSLHILKVKLLNKDCQNFTLDP